MTGRGVIAASMLLVTGCGAAASWWPFQDSQQRLTLSGLVEVQEVRLGSKVGGRVAEVMVREGDIAEAGQVLMRFAVPELEAQFRQQEGRVAAMEATLLKAENGPRPEEIQQMRSELQNQQAEVKWTQDELNRAERLFYKEKAITEANWQSAKTARDRAQSRLDATRALLDILEEGTRDEDKALAEANVVEAKGRLDELRTLLNEAEVVAPERERVEVVSVRKGDLIPPNTPVIRVLRADDLWVKVYVPETELGKVRMDQKVSVTCDAYPNRPLPGVVFQIAHEAEFTPRNVQSQEERRYQVFGVKVRVEDPDGIFKAGMSASVTFQF
jgi:HlyD family secretion protein